MEPVEYLRILRRRWHLPVAGLLLGLVAAWMTTPARSAAVPEGTTFSATHTLVATEDDDRLSRRGLDADAFLVTTGDVPRRAAEKLGYDRDPAILAGQVTATATPEIGALSITSTQDDGDRAAATANAFAEALVEYLADEAAARRSAAIAEVSGRLESLEASIAELDAQLGGDPDDSPILRAQRDALVRQYSVAYEQFQQLAADATGGAGYTTLQEATPVPIRTGGFQAPSDRSTRLLLAGAFGLLLGTGLALVLERFDTRIRTRAGAEAAFGLPVLAEVPLLPRRLRAAQESITATQPRTAFAEAHRILRSAVTLTPLANVSAHAVANGNGNGHAFIDRLDIRHEGDVQVVLVTSPGPGEGKTTTVANLAASFAESGRSVLVLSTDLRRPRVHELLGVEEGVGIRDVLAATPNGPRVTDAIRPTSIPGVSIMTAGSAESERVELVGQEKHLVATARHLADIILLDTAPLLLTNEASELLTVADVVLTVCRAGRTTSDAAERAAELLRRLHAPTAGVVLVGSSLAIPNRSYYTPHPTAEARPEGPVGSPSVSGGGSPRVG